MFTQLNKTFELINNLNNSKFIEKKIDQKILDEQQQNLSDLESLLEKYSEVLKILQTKDKIEREDLTFFIGKVHMSLIDLIWHIDEMDGLLQTFSRSIAGKNLEN